MRNSLSKFRNRVAGFGAGLAASFVTASAFAGDLSDAITAELTTGKAEIMAVGAIVLALTGTVLLIAYVRRSAK